MYSETLRELVMHCVMYESDHRVGVVELQERVEEGRRVCKEVRKRKLVDLDDIEGAPIRFWDGLERGSGEWIEDPLTFKVPVK